MRKKLHVKTGDQVIVISGNSKGHIGKVVGVSPKEGKVIVVSSRHRLLCIPARFSSTATNAKSPQEPLTRSTATRKLAFAPSAAQSFNPGGRRWLQDLKKYTRTKSLPLS